MQISDACANAGLDAIETAAGSAPYFQLYSGAMPSLCSGARTGTKLAEGQLPSDWLTNATARTKSKSGTWSGAGLASGFVGYYSIQDTAKANTNFQGLIAQSWAASTAYSLNQQVNNGGNVYKVTTAGASAGSGGPTGTGASITDGGVTWAYVGATDMTIDNGKMEPGQAVSVSNFTITYPAAG